MADLIGADYSVVEKNALWVSAGNVESQYFVGSAQPLGKEPFYKQE